MNCANCQSGSMLMNLTLNTKNFKLCYISFIPAQDRISGQSFNEIANMNLLMILKLNYREVAQARWKKRIFQIPSNFCERIVTHLEVSKTEVECFITRFQTP